MTNNERPTTRCRVLREAADPTARGVAVPEDAMADVEAVRFRILFRQLDFRHRRTVLRIQLVDDAPVGLDAPEVAVVPGEPMGPHSGRWDRSDDLAGFGFHQEQLAR